MKEIRTPSLCVQPSMSISSKDFDCNFDQSFLKSCPSHSIKIFLIWSDILFSLKILDRYLSKGMRKWAAGWQPAWPGTVIIPILSPSSTQQMRYRNGRREAIPRNYSRSWIYSWSAFLIDTVLIAATRLPAGRQLSGGVALWHRTTR